MEEQTQPTDAKLIAKYLKGDEESLAVLFSRHLDSALLFARSLVGASEAEDAVSEASVKVWKNLKKFDPQKKFKTWFIAILKNTCLDMLRKKQPTVFSDFENDDGENQFLDSLADDAPLPPEFADAALASEMVKAALLKLAPKNRLVIQMYYFDQMTLQEIADILEESVNTIKSRFRRALFTLKNDLSLKK